MTKNDNLELAFDNVERLGLLAYRLKVLNDILCRYLERSCDLDGTPDERTNALCLVQNSGNMSELSCIMFEVVLELNEVFEALGDSVGSLYFGKDKEKLDNEHLKV